MARAQRDDFRLARGRAGLHNRTAATPLTRVSPTLTPPMNNLHTVEEIYAAFARSDIETILGNLSPDVQFDPGAAPNAAPWLKPRQGIDGVRQFFAALQQVEFKRFKVKGLYGGARVIVAVLDIEFLVTATGKTVADSDEVHLWEFDDRGRVQRFLHRVDSHQHHLAALKG